MILNVEDCSICLTQESPVKLKVGIVLKDTGSEFSDLSFGTRQETPVSSFSDDVVLNNETNGFSQSLGRTPVSHRNKKGNYLLGSLLRFFRMET